MREVGATPTVCVKALRAAFFTAAARSGTPLPELAARADVPLSLLAFLLGFSDLSGFSRAFRRWTGKSPGTYMREHA